MAVALLLNFELKTINVYEEDCHGARNPLSVYLHPDIW